MTRQRLSNLLIIFLLLALIAGSNPSPQEQYYRGVYDICTYYGLRAQHTPAFVEKACKAYTAKWIKAKRYEKASKNWEWPLKVAEETR